MLDSPPGMESSRLYVKIRRKRLEISPAERDLWVWADGVCLGVRTERENKKGIEQRHRLLAFFCKGGIHHTSINKVQAVSPKDCPLESRDFREEAGL